MLLLKMEQGFDHLADGTALIEGGQHDGQAALACRSFTFRSGRHSGLQSSSGYRQLARSIALAWTSVMQSFWGLSLSRRPGPPLNRSMRCSAYQFRLGTFVVTLQPDLAPRVGTGQGCHRLHGPGFVELPQPQGGVKQQGQCCHIAAAEARSRLAVVFWCCRAQPPSA